MAAHQCWSLTWYQDLQPGDRCVKLALMGRMLCRMGRAGTRVTFTGYQMLRTTCVDTAVAGVGAHTMEVLGWVVGPKYRYETTTDQQAPSFHPSGVLAAGWACLRVER